MQTFLFFSAQTLHSPYNTLKALGTNLAYPYLTVFLLHLHPACISDGFKFFQSPLTAFKPSKNYFLCSLTAQCYL